MSVPRDVKSDSIDSLPADVQERLAEILEEYLAQLEQGQAPHVDELVAQYPELAEPLKSFLASVDFLHGASAGFRSNTQPRTPEPAAEENQLGDYRLVREIGRGGMGVVYEANQVSLGRRVALKVLPFAAVLDQRQIARFKNEAQAAAHLQHPNIVPVYSVGCDRGVHYYAMQYIEGQPLDRAIDELRGRSAAGGPGANDPDATVALDAMADTRGAEADTWKSLSGEVSPRSRDYCRTVARIGIEAAEALEYAHECGVIHRDIKPSNLLVDNHGRVWITDFGLARFQTEGSLTMTGDLMGTLRYMSPEQASGKKAAVDQRTDVYSLGITLYELCTLTNVFEESDRQSLLREVAEQEPKAPRQINPAIPVDLETILLKAIAKAPQERYAAAGELAADLRRFLDGEPIAARRASLADRVGKWSRRHKSFVGAAVVLLCVVLAGSLVGTLLIANEHAKTREALAQAESNLNRADTHFRQLRNVVDRFGSYHAQRLKDLPGAEPVRRAMLVDTLQCYQQFIEHAGNDPTLQNELAVGLTKAADVNKEIEKEADALANYRRAAAIFHQLSIAAPDHPSYRAKWALCMNNVGQMLSNLGKPGEAQDAYREAIAAFEKLTAEHPESSRYQGELATAYSNLGLLATKGHDVPEAKQIHLKAIALHKSLVEEHPDEPDFLHELAVSYNNLSFFYARTDPAKAEAVSRQSLAIQSGLVKDYPGRLKYQSALAVTYNNLGALESHNGLADEAEASYRRAIELQQQLVRKSPSVIRHRHDLAVSYSNLGRAYSKRKQLKRAEAAFEKAQAVARKLVDDYPGQLSYRSSLGGILNNLGTVYEETGRLDEATRAFQQAIEHQQFAWKGSPRVGQFREFLAQHCENYQRVLRRAGRWNDAIEIADCQRQLAGGNPEELYRIALGLAAGANAIAAEKREMSEEEAKTRHEYEAMALATLEQAISAGLEPNGRIERDREWSGLRDKPEFVRLLRRSPPKAGQS